MATVRFFGKPTFFITFTANPRWPEIVRNLLPGQQPADRPELIARVFYRKLQVLITDLKEGLFGPYAGHVCTIEYQKRGLPHYTSFCSLSRPQSFSRLTGLTRLSAQSSMTRRGILRASYGRSSLLR
jgi:hypothetical protein